MRVFIAGLDGYLGWPLTQHLTAQGYEVAGLDYLLRRQWVAELDSHSAIPIADIYERLRALSEHYGTTPLFRVGNLLDYDFLKSFLADFQPDVIVHLAEMPSAAYSMIDQQHATMTQHNNVIGNLNILWAIKEVCPTAHLIKLGTMGEYGTPNTDIPEGFFEIEFRGRRDTFPFPRQASSFYHWSKVHDSNNIMFACKLWGLRATDVMQGIVFGTRIADAVDDSRLATRLDFDQCFGTVINRFCCQAAIGHPLTIYGQGQQVRSFLPLRDVMQCIELIIQNPPELGEYRVINQYGLCYSVRELAEIVQEVASNFGLDIALQEIANPRVEKENHYYNPDRERLLTFGYQPTLDIKPDIRQSLADILPHQERIAEKRDILTPDITWHGAEILELDTP